jgi:membrane-associated protease RseP (regulator of RpoE activity)
MTRWFWLVGLAWMAVAPARASGPSPISRPDGAPARAAPKKEKDKAKEKAPAKGEEPYPGIHVLGKDSYRIEQKLWDKYLHNLDAASRLARADPHHTDRGVEGWVLSSVDKDGPVHAAGLHNGDRVVEINGKKLGGMPGLALTLQGLKNDAAYTVKIVRKDGDRRTLKYTVR